MNVVNQHVRRQVNFIRGGPDSDDRAKDLKLKGNG